MSETSTDPRREELLRIAREVFAEQGFESTGIRDIASRMGILGGSLYHYIDSKQALLAEVMREFHAPALPIAAATADDSRGTRERLTDMMRSHVEVVATDPLGMTLAFTAVDHLPEDARSAMRDQMRSYRRGVEALVRDGQARGELRPELDTGLAAMAIVGALNWTSRWLRPDGQRSASEVGEQLAGLLYDGIAADGWSPGAAPLTIEATPKTSPGEREAKVWATAAHLFRTEGFDGTSMADLAKAVGLGKASLYHYVSTKEQLLLDVMLSVQEPSTRAMEALAGREEPAAERLRAALAFNVTYITDHLDGASLVLHAQRSLAPERRALVLELAEAYTAAMGRILQDGRDAGDLRPEPDRNVALQGILGVVNWPYRWYRPRGQSDARRIADGLADVVMGGLAVRS